MPNYEGHVVHNYRLERVLGEGGFGVVYLALHQELGRQAAVKILHPEFSRQPNLVERFFREAKSVCAIGHRSIIDVQNVGRLESGEPFCLMEYFDGQSLSDHVRDHGAILLHLLPSVFDPVAEALMAAHGQGIVHRDLKPDNIMVRAEGGRIVDVKLLDFGIAKLIDGKDTVSSRTGLPMGTPTFMAPEQARDSKNVDHRADVYGFGATVFAALAKRPPYMADNVTDLIVKAQTTEAPGIRTFVPEAPIELERALARCLRKQPEQRPESIAVAWQQMRSAIAAHAPTAPPHGAADNTVDARLGPLAFQNTTPAGGADALSADSLARTRIAGPGSRRWWWLAAVVVAAAAAAVVVALVVTAGEPTPAAVVVVDAAPTPIDAEVAVDAAPERVVVMDAAPVDARAVVEQPRPRKIDAATRATGPDCSTKSFARVYDAPNPREAVVQRALKRLKQCNQLGHIDDARYDQIRAALVRKL